jgi:hypothetical protein
MHAHNPVNWFPWGPEAFAKAKAEGKLVFLSIGYSSCYWCHVMERESFQSHEVAKLLNDMFVCVKVDREERPDIDSVYMTALHVLGQQGGWPLSMFLTADGKPIVGGTYWPPEDRVIQDQKARGFKSIIRFIHDWHKEKPDEVTGQAGEVATRTADALAGHLRGIALVELNRDLVSAAVDGLRAEFDPVHGGFGAAERNFKGTKFPVPGHVLFLLDEAKRSQSTEVMNIVTLTLDHMARGGIYDQLGGGFHRYSTERTWTVPHFEKMLYDNAQLIELYALAFARTKDPLYRRIVEESMAFIQREMTAPSGGFYSALDAETEGEEGRFYVWTPKELADALADMPDSDVFRKAYGIGDAPNFEGKYHILQAASPLANLAREMKITESELLARLAPLADRLRENRSKRPRPFLDTKILTGWNGQMIAGLAVAGNVLNDPKSTDMAIRAAEFILRNLRTADGRLLRVCAASPGKPPEAKLNGYLEDYAYFVHGLLALHDATNDGKWLAEAKSLTDTMIKLHADMERGGFYFTSHDHEKLFARAKDQYDSVQPSGNSSAAMNLVRLWQKTGDASYRDLAERTFRNFAGSLKSNPTGMTSMAHALSVYLDAQESRLAANAKDALPGDSKKPESLVKVKAESDKPAADGTRTVTLTLSIEPGWHVYANPVPDDFPGVPVSVSFGPNIPAENVRIEYPPGKSVKDSLLGEYRIYEKEAKIKAKITRSKDDEKPLEASVKIQTCSKEKCLLPVTIKVAIP